MANAQTPSIESLANLPLQASEKVVAGLRAKGYRPVTLWLPDTTAPGFAEECRRQSEVIKASASERNYLDELDLPEVEGWS